MITFVLLISTAFQVASALIAFRLLGRTRLRWPWLVVSLALAGMALRRGLTMASGNGQLAAELLALAVSVLLLVGVVGLSVVFRGDERDRSRTEEELRAHRERLEEEVQKRTAELRVAEETFRALAENTQDVIMRFDRRHRHLYVNPVVQEQTGIPVEGFLGKTHAEIGFPDHLCALWEGAIERVFETGEAGRIEFELPNGVCIDWLLMPEFAGGRVASVITTARDITERVRAAAELRAHRDHLEDLVAQRTAALVASNARLESEVEERRRVEEALRESEERFRTLYDNLSIGLYRTTPDGRIVMANPAFARMLGFDSLADLARLDLENDAALPGYSRPAFRAMIEERGEVSGHEWVLPRPDGSAIHVRESAKLIRDADGTPLFYDGALEDVSAQKQLEERLRHGQKMQALGTLAGGIAHDFNNLLMAMRGSIGLLRHERGGAGSRELAILDQSVERAASLVRGLLAFANRQVLEPVDLDLGAVVREMAPMLRRMVPESIALDLAVDDQPTVVRADKSQLEQVIVNLCANARDAMPDGGRLRIAVDRAGEEPSRTAILTVSDDGCGMDEGTLARAFEPFFTTKPPGKGTGMGLATVYGIVRQHGGATAVNSTAGQGTVCTVSLPLSEHAAQTTPPQPPAAVGGRETLLVAEDDAEVRHVLVESLRGFGYQVLEAVDGQAALERLRSSSDKVDLVVTDVVMPRLGGFELAAIVAREAADVRFLFSSGYAEDAAAEAALAGPVHFIAKPYSIDELARKVREALDAPRVGASNVPAVPAAGS